MTANTPQKPHTEGMEWTNAETGIKYMFTNGGWRAVSSEASQEVADAIDGLDLQTVLDNGNVADKGATFGGKITVEPGTTGNEAVTYQQMVDSSTGNYLPITGGDLGGNLTVNGTGASGTAPFVVRKDGYYTSFVVERNGNVFAGSNETAYFNASKPSHVITKGHLDDRLLHPGMGLRWKYSNGDTTPAGYFAISGGFSFRISHTTHDGEDYFKTLCSKDHGSKTLYCLLTVYQISAGKYKPCEVFELRKCRFGRNSSQMEFEYNAKAQAHSLTDGNIYYITIGGLF